MKLYYKNRLLSNTALTYNDLDDVPLINNSEIRGNMSSRELNMYNIPQVDRAILKNRPIKIVDHIPSITDPVTIYYVGPDSENNYDKWLYDDLNRPLYLGNTDVPEYSEGLGIDINQLTLLVNEVNVAYDGVLITLNSEGDLCTAFIEPGDAIDLSVDDSELKQVISVLNDSETIYVSDDGLLKAVSIPQPTVEITYLGLDENNTLVWKSKFLNSVELKDDKNTEEVKVIWYGTEKAYEDIWTRDSEGHISEDAYNFSLYVVNTNDDPYPENFRNVYNNLGKRPSINGQILSGDKSSLALNMYTKSEIDELLTTIRNFRVSPVLPTVPEPNTLYYIGTGIPYDMYLVDEDQNPFYLGTSRELEYVRGPGIYINSDNVVGALGAGEFVDYPDDMPRYESGELAQFNELFVIGDSELHLSPFVNDNVYKPGIPETPTKDDVTGILNSVNKWEKNLEQHKLYQYMPGEVKLYAGRVIPAGWLLCDGSAVSRLDFKDLFAAIGTTYGSGDGVNTFNLPNFVNRFAEGFNVSNGSVYSSGVPNITGSFAYQFNDTASIGITQSGSYTPTAKSALYTATNGGVGYSSRITGSNQSKPIAIGLDASRSNSIYGQSNTVQPAATCINYMIKY